MKRVGKLRPSPAMAVACVALFVALGGGAYAAATINGKSIKNGTITPNKIKARSLSGSQFRANGIGGPSIKESTLGEVPKAKAAQTATSATTATNATQLGGQAATAYQRYGSTIPAGQTVTGSFGCYQESAQPAPACRVVESLPLPAPVALNDGTVNFAGGGTGFDAADADPTCQGNATNPAAPAGKVCLYFANRINPGGSVLVGQGNVVSGTSGTNGFEVQLTSGGALPILSLEGTWAYTAP
jgi:hypothetical protein